MDEIIKNGIKTGIKIILKCIWYLVASVGLVILTLISLIACITPGINVILYYIFSYLNNKNRN